MEFNFSDNDYYEKYPPSFGNGTDLNMHLALIDEIEAKPTNTTSTCSCSSGQETERRAGLDEEEGLGKQKLW